MLFWIFVGITALLWILCFIHGFREGRWLGFISGGILNGCLDGLYLLMSAAFVWFLLIFLPLFGYYGTERVWKGSIPIVSLKDSSSIEGHFFLGSGSIKDKTYYVYYKKLSDTQFQMDKIETEGCIIEENSSVEPNVYFEAVYYSCPSWLAPFGEFRMADRNRKIIVPKGTIIRQFKLE